MNTPEQPASPPLTRKQMRELRNTGATPIVTQVADEETAAPATPEAPAQPTPPAPAPLPRAAEPAAVAERPMPDAAVDLGVSPLTRRQARQQERIRTASVPVITPDVIAAHTEPVAAEPVRAPEPSPAPQPSPAPAAPEEDSLAELFGHSDADEPAPQPEALASPVDSPESAAPAASVLGFAEAVEPEQPVFEAAPAPEPEPERVVSPALGAALLGTDMAKVDVPPSFDQLLSPSSSGSSSAPSALIMSQTPTAPMVAPVTATGDVIVTGTFNLPEGLGSTGHAAGTADGKDVDAVLVDGELPAHSSPTPIAASSAISTSKSAGEVITPPTPEKGGRLMMVLAITAGVLALALVGVLILAFVTGVFS